MHNALLWAFLCLFALAGCGKIVGPKPCPTCGTPPPPEYPVRDTPKRAVWYLRVGWEQRDSTRADTVYATDYQGKSVDLTDPNSGTLIFFKSDEIRAIHGLKEDPTVNKVEMQFGDSTVWASYHDLQDPSDWVVVQVSSPTIFVRYVSQHDLGVTGSKTFEFTVRPVTTGGKTLWEIVRWNEVHN